MRQRSRKRGGPERQGRSASRRLRHTYFGTVQKNPRGFAFIIEEHGVIADTYLSRDDSVGLMDGDKVEFAVVPRGRRSSGEIVRVIERARTKVLGQIRAHDPLFLHTLEQDIYRLEDRKGEKETWVIADIIDYPSLHSMGKAKVVQRLGKTLEPKHDTVIAIALFGLPNEFETPTLAEAEKWRHWHGNEGERKDLRHLPLVTIDGEDAKDFDDAVFVGEDKQHPFILYVSIADVSFFVREGSTLDRTAQERGTSVYFPGRCVPMLPETLSNDLCSLRPQLDRLTVTCEVAFNREGEIQEYRLYESVIRTVARLTYNEINDFFEHKSPARENLKPLEKSLKHMFALYKLLARKRKERGVLDFDLPESKMELDSEDKPILVRQAPRYDSHRLIEEFMIMANQLVAKTLRENKIPCLFRVHEPPDSDGLDEVNRLLKSLGINDRITEITPINFARALKKTESIQGHNTVHQIILRTQKQAVYGPEPKGHFGLALRDYLHFTSPIRRYPDLLVHRCLKKIIRMDVSSEKRIVREWADLGRITSSLERRAMKAENFVVRRKQCWYMKERLGEIYDGTVSWITDQGIFVTLPEMALEGYLPSELLEGAYEFDEERRTLIKERGKHAIRIGDPIKVQVASVSMDSSQITFAKA